MFLVFRANGARDWATNLEISTKHGDKVDKVEFHHIFPKAYMRKVRPDLDPRLVDDIANLAFIGSKTNKEISDHAPKEYAALFPEDFLKAQLVEFAEGTDDPGGFERFIENRRASLAEAINKFLGLSQAG